MVIGDERLPARFWTKVEIDTKTGCWNWIGARDRGGYGCFSVSGKTRGAHRVAYEALVDDVPRGLELDHRICQRRHCCNPAHLEPVTRQINVLRGKAPSAEHAKKTHCPQGHPYDRLWARSSRPNRTCSICQRERGRRRREKAAAAGLCTTCKRAPAAPGRTMCEPDLEAMREAQRKRKRKGRAL